MKAAKDETIDWFEICELVLSQELHAEITERFIKGYQLGLAGYPADLIKEAIAACLREPGRNSYPRTGEIIGHIQRLRGRERGLSLVRAPEKKAEDTGKLSESVIEETKKRFPQMFS